MGTGESVPAVVRPGEDDQRASWATVIVCTVIVAAAAAAAVLIYVRTDPRIEIDATGFAVFAPIYIVAQALERLFEPWSTRLNSTTPLKDSVKLAREAKLAAQRARDAARTAGAGELDDAQWQLDEATTAELAAVAMLRKRRSERTVIWWCVATTAALLLCGVLGLGLLNAIATNKLDEYVRALDIVLTGAAIGAGTKPLHDLISRIEKSKTNADPATKPTAQLPGTPAAPSG